MFIPPPQKQEERLQLELPDYSEAYRRWIEKQKSEQSEQETVIIIDLY
jgi:hypothetical protein